jgi:hypothetical protein
VLKSFSSVKMVCKCFGSVINMYGVLKNCGSVIVFCEYNESVVDVYGDKLRRVSVVKKRSKRN